MSRWERPICSAYRTLGREEDARDAAQDAFLVPTADCGGLKARRSSPRGSTITLNLCRDWIAKSVVRRVQYGHRPGDPADAQASPTES